MTTLTAMLRERASATPAAAAILAPKRTPLTYRGLWDAVAAIKAQLDSLALAPGARVAVVMPECPEMAAAILAIAPRKPGSVGVSTGPALAIFDEHGAPLPPHAIGEVALRGPGVFSGYADDDAATRRSFRDGWFLTGDLGYLDDEGPLFLVGRLKEMINRGGEKISPHEVEQALLTHPDVERAVAFGVPHPVLGETVAAAVIPRAGAVITPAELREHVAARLAYFKVPAPVLMVEAIPANAMGKVPRSGLATHFGLTGAPERLEADHDDLERILQELDAITDEEAADRLLEQIESGPFNG